MTKEELSQKIAESFEPTPAWKDWQDGETHWQFYIRSTMCVSDGGYWEVFRALDEDDATKHPRPYDDPEITVRLLRWLIANFTVLVVHKDYVRAEPALGKYYEGNAYGEDIARAIAEVVAKARGLI